MGALRLFLAVSVLVGHTAPLFGLHLLPPTVAVRVFFMISGFYMALVLADKYRGKPLLFYSNRALRLYPTYWLALALTVAAAGHVPQHLPPDWPSMLAALIPNLALFGGDLLFQFHHGQAGWQYTFGQDVFSTDPTAVRTGVWLVVSPAWSLGTELTFYLLAPALARANLKLLLALAAASLGLQLWLDHQLHTWTSYFFFPANLCYFLFGMLAYRFTATPLFRWLDSWRAWSSAPPLGLIGALGALALLGGREFIPLFRNYSWMHYLVAGCAVPFIFHRSARLKWDRWVGELSYPVYLFHLVASEVVVRFYGAQSALWTLAITLPLSVAVVVWLEAPIERWRQRQAAVDRQPPLRSGRAAAATTPAE